MSEWWTYRPSDFLMFSARTWGRLVQGWNEAMWPLQWLVLAVACALLLATARRPHAARRPALVLLALAWAGVGWGFLLERLSTVNTGAPWHAAAFGLQAVLLLVAAALPDGHEPGPAMRRAGLVLAALAIVADPLLTGWIAGTWRQAEVAGLMPDPTALLTTGLLLALPQRHRMPLLVVPLLSLVVGWTTAWLLRAG